MTSNLGGKDYLGGLTSAFSEWLGNWLTSLFGAGVHDPVFGPISWADLGVMGCLVALVLLLDLVVVAALRRQLHQGARRRGGSGMQHHVFGALDKPLHVLIWVYGIYFAATPLLVKLNPEQGVHLLRVVFDKVFDVGVFAILFWLFFRFTHVLDAQLASWASRSSNDLDDLFAPLLGKSLRIIVPVVGIIFAMPLLALPPEFAGVVGKGSSILLIVSVAVILFQAVHVGEKAVLVKFDITAADNLRARKVYTQIHVFSKVLYAIITLFTIASVLMLFQEVRSYGRNLLASAGVVGIILGFAAQKTIANLFAGFQLALTQPIRLDDVVVVEGEWGRVEEITLTYVIIHIWDDRRLIVPLSYFIDKPFQNWTRVSAELLGSVFVWVDYTMPVAELRKALKEIIETDPLWDKRFWNLQVVDSTETTMKLRVLATTADSSNGWDLRCAIREKLIAYIQQQHPQSLPRVRTELSGEPPGWLAKP